MKKRRYSRVLAAVHAAIWLILPEKLEAICALLDERSRGVRLSKVEIRQRIGNASRPADAVLANRVAVLNLFGVVCQRMTLMEEISGGTSTEQFGQAFDAAIADETVKAIVINVDSPGGTVVGVPELADKIRAARGSKPIIAVANAMCCSAAYWIASAADKLIATPSAMVGSIGAMRIHSDTSKADEKAGVKYTLITSAKYKAEANPYEPLSETAAQEWQKKVDDVGQRFVAAVASNRGLSSAKVLADFGQGRWFHAEAALAVGMVDQLAALDQVLSDLGVGAGAAGTTAAASAPAFSLENVTMDKKIFERLVQLGLCSIDATEAVAQAALQAWLVARGFVGAKAIATTDASKVLEALGAPPAEPPTPPNAGANGQGGQGGSASTGAGGDRMSADNIIAAVRLSAVPLDRQLALAGELTAQAGSLSTSQILRRIEEEGAKAAPPTGATNIEATVAERDKFTAAARDAILCRQYGGNLPTQIYDRHLDEMVDFKPSHGRRSHALASLTGLGRQCMVACGIPAASIDRLHNSEVARILVGAPLRDFGIVASSDGPAFNVSGMFSNILLNAQNVILRRSYLEAKTTFQVWARAGESIKDFKPVNKVIAGELSDPKAVPEDGEFEETTLTDGKESYKLTVWGQIFSITWQTIVNDQLSAFTRIPMMQGTAMRRKQNKLVYQLLKDNSALADGVALFDATALSGGGHNNRASGAATPTVATFNTMYTKMAEQTGLEGSNPLNLEPSFVLAPPALRGTILELLGSTANPASNGNSGVKNVWENALSPVFDAQLAASAGGSDTRWILAADSNDVDTVEYAYLEGLEAPAIEMETAFSSLAQRHRIYQAFAVKALDFRGFQDHLGV